MVSEQARALSLRLLASYPGTAISEMNIVALAETLDRIGLDIAEPVVERARTEVLKPPSSAQLYEIAREIRVEMEPPEYQDHSALTPGEFVAEMPPEVREKVQRMRDGWAEIDDMRSREAMDADWAKRKRELMSGLRMAGACIGTDKPPVEVDGELVCPVCRIPIEDVRVAERRQLAADRRKAARA